MGAGLLRDSLGVSPHSLNLPGLLRYSFLGIKSSILDIEFTDLINNMKTTERLESTLPFSEHAS